MLSRSAFMLCLLGCGPATDPAPAPRDPISSESSAWSSSGDSGASLFHLEMTLQDQTSRPFTLASLRGHPVLVAFFYSSCGTMCPTLIADLHRLEAMLSPAARDELRVVLVSFDGERDTAERLAEVAAERDIDLSRWVLVRGDEREVRTLAATLGMTYRRTRDGEFAHIALFSLLDGEGSVVLQRAGTGLDVTPLSMAVEALVHSAAPVPPT